MLSQNHRIKPIGDRARRRHPRRHSGHSDRRCCHAQWNAVDQNLLLKHKFTPLLKASAIHVPRDDGFYRTGTTLRR
jgi:hypothetical protein